MYLKTIVLIFKIFEISYKIKKDFKLVTKLNYKFFKLVITLNWNFLKLNLKNFNCPVNYIYKILSELLK